jgi:hypothetical protein
VFWEEESFESLTLRKRKPPITYLFRYLSSSVVRQEEREASRRERVALDVTSMSHVPFILHSKLWLEKTALETKNLLYFAVSNFCDFEHATSQNSTLPTMTSSRPVTVEDEEGARAYNKMDRPVSPPIEHMISSFNQELDHLTKSLDDALSTCYRSSPNESSMLHNNRPYSSVSTAQKPTPLKHVLDPPPSLGKVSPLYSGMDSTPARSRTSRQASSSTARPPMSTTPARSARTRAEPPPAPVETPAYNLFPSSTTNNRRGRESHREDTSRDNFASRRDENMKTGLAREEKLDNSWQDALENMRATLAQQDQRIRELERDNKDLRHELQSSRAPPQSRKEPQSYRSEPRPYQADASSPYREDPRSYREDPSPYRQEEPARMYPREQEPPSIQRPYREEPMGRTPMSASSTFRTSPHTPRGPPNRIDLLSSPAGDPFSPGTKFVAELARLLKMEDGHHAPLSLILDKHWDQLQYHFGNQNA